MITDFRNPEYWMRTITLAALVGLACGAVGLLFSFDWLLFVGATLCTPLFLGAIASLLLVPYAVCVRRKDGHVRMAKHEKGLDR